MFSQNCQFEWMVHFSLIETVFSFSIVIKSLGTLVDSLSFQCLKLNCLQSNTSMTQKAKDVVRKP